MSKTKVFVRPIVAHDMLDVLDIEDESFPIPWTESEFIRVLHGRNSVGLVAEIEDERKSHAVKLAGYCIVEKLRETKLRILNFAVSRDCRRRGVGTAMIKGLLEFLPQLDRTEIDFTICESNLGGQLFLRSMGFRAVKVLRGYYRSVVDDAYLFRLKCSVRCTIPLLDATRPSGK